MSDNDPVPRESSVTEQATLTPDAEQAGAEEVSGPQQLDEQREKYLRLAAEYDNYRRRTVKERQEAQMRGQADMLRGLIDPLDNNGRFSQAHPPTTDSKTLVDGVAMVEK